MSGSLIVELAEMKLDMRDSTVFIEDEELKERSRSRSDWRRSRKRMPVIYYTEGPYVKKKEEEERKKREERVREERGRRKRKDGEGKKSSRRANLTIIIIIIIIVDAVKRDAGIYFLSLDKAENAVATWLLTRKSMVYGPQKETPG